ncbi:Resolvase domain protein [Ancylobacter novellus DSM 506]|uniref:Resolvase domain protein n=1 Tax=Ancylobacter novellus (strain ATCC 8093 / DSM 506 / JCM 20403 / CCM 1077 / IAM 12100 / NBRC 12443 / NCIMB 10456) TaxID=639283 RepID=D7A5I1_ANCN5|nr:recombinase family protein [Ancylobacter novellus]ADH88105.1 Resolvase domain protein [Ancylobacter novellus DSM 506]
MTRVALYARYSSDNQRDASIEDQLRQSRDYAERQGWSVVESFTDRAISGASLIRPGIQKLMADVQGGRFDIVLSEALDRISRDQEDVAAVYKRLRFAGVQLITLSEGEISELHVGLKGTMNALFLKDLALKTHRGIRGRVEAGKLGGGNAYGYRVMKQLDARGEPIRGEREIVEDEAEIVRRIFREYAAGKGPQRIAADLNRKGIPGPTGGRWSDTTIRGNRAVGSGILNCELYIGIIRWNRQRRLKDPATGSRVMRMNPQSSWVRKEVPELRIIDDALWEAVKARQTELGEVYRKNIEGGLKALEQRATANALNATHRPRTMLSGLMFCGCCEQPYVRRGQDRYCCTSHLMGTGCTNSRTVTRDKLEERVVNGLKHRLMAPDKAAEAMRAFAEETNRLNRERRASSESDRQELAQVETAIREIVAVIEQGGFHRALLDRLTVLEAKQAELQESLARAPVDVPDLHPNIAELYRRKVERLSEALDHPEDRYEAIDAIRQLVTRVVLTPGAKRGEVHAVLHGDIVAIADWVLKETERPRKAGHPTHRAHALARVSEPVEARAWPGDPRLAGRSKRY